MGTICSGYSVRSLVMGFLVLGLLTFGLESSAYAIIKKSSGVEMIATDQAQSAEAEVVRDYCSFEGTVTDAATGEPVVNAQVAFFLGDSTHTLRTTTNDSGHYYLRVAAGRYFYTVKHPDFEIRSNAPDTIEVVLPYTKRVGLFGGFYREELYTGDSYKTVNIQMEARSSHVLLVTTSLLSKTPTFDDSLAAYIEAMESQEGLAVTYVEVDSHDCRDRFGVQVLDRSNWEEYKPVIRDIAASIGARTIILLGGEAVVPRPTELVMTYYYVGFVPSDAWYIDMDDDQVVDPGWVVSRMPDVSTASEAVEAALQSATDLHYAGGYGMSREVGFSRSCWAPAPTGLGDLCEETDSQCGTCYDTPPYGVCDTCDRQAEFFDLISDHDYIRFAGHGSATGFWTNEMEPIFNIDYMDYIDLQTHHPVITGYISCNTGCLRGDESSLSTELMRAGAAVFVARTLTEGTPSHFHSYFEDALKGKTDGKSHQPYRIGDAMFDLMRESVLVQGRDSIHNAAQLAMVGDPTLRRKWTDTLTLLAPVLKISTVPLTQ